MRATMRARARPESRRTRPPSVRPTDRSAVDHVLDLQSNAGNRAVVRLLQRQPVAAPEVAPEAPATIERKTLRFGSKGSDVFYLQSRLNRAPEVTTHLSVDGNFGSKTLKAVREFQRAHAPLEVDGVVGPNTWEEVQQVPDEPTGREAAEAEKIFNRGAEEYAKGRYAHAYDFFTRAGELLPKPGILFSRAQSLRYLGARREEAVALYEEYLGMEGGTRKADAATALAELRGPGKTGDETTDTAAGRALRHGGGQGAVREGSGPVRRGPVRTRLRRVHQGLGDPAPARDPVLAGPVPPPAGRTPRAGDRPVRGVPGYGRRHAEGGCPPLGRRAPVLGRGALGEE